MNFVFLDSGVGGVPYMMSLKHAKKDAHCLYVADTANFPYGTKSAEEVAKCAAGAILAILKRWKPDAIVIACNTISVVALNTLRKQFPTVSLIGTVPAVKLAAKVSKNHCIGLLATECTVQNKYTADLEKQFASDCTIFPRGDSDLVRFIEHSFFTASKEQRLSAVTPAVEYFKHNNCDVIILGCTHFTHVAEDIAEAAGDRITVVDSREGVARQAIKIAAKNAEHRLLCTDSMSDVPADMSLFVTGAKSDDGVEEYRVLCTRMRIPWGGVI